MRDNFGEERVRVEDMEMLPEGQYEEKMDASPRKQMSSAGVSPAKNDEEADGD